MRIKSGIPGFDELVGGGFVPGSAILVSGQSGTGKTVFGLQFLWNGLVKGEAGLYVSFEETPKEIREDALSLGWNFDAFEKKGMCKIDYYDPFEVSDMNVLLLDEINRVNAKRVVIDSVSVFAMHLKDTAMIRKRVYKLIETLKRTGATILLLSETLEDSRNFSRFGIEEFIADGVISLSCVESEGMFTRFLAVRKMRRTQHTHEIHPFEIGKNGLELFAAS